MNAHGLAQWPRLVVQGNFRSDTAHDAALRLLRLEPRPTAVFASNNLMALGLMRALRELGLRCPEQVSIAAFDDFEEASLFSPGLTTVAQPTAAIGAKAVQMLLRRIGQRDRAAAPEVSTMEATLQIRGSSGPPSDGPSRAATQA